MTSATLLAIALFVMALGAAVVGGVFSAVDRFAASVLSLIGAAVLLGCGWLVVWASGGLA